MSNARRQRAPRDAVLHKAFPECSITEPHPPDICGLVEARRQVSRAAAGEEASPDSPDLEA